MVTGSPPSGGSCHPNGASELIDLIARCGTTVGGFKNGPFPTQYKEYERSAAACGYAQATACGALRKVRLSRHHGGRGPWV